MQRDGYSRKVIPVSFWLYDQFELTDLAGPADVFASATAALKASGKRGGYKIHSFTAGEARVSSESKIMVESQPGEPPPGGMLVVPGGAGTRSAKAQAEFCEWLGCWRHRFARICSVCTGAYLLAAAGVLDGRRVTTHWRFAQDLAKSFPKVQVDSDSIYLRSGDVFTSAGVTAGIDLSLALVEADFGAGIAQYVAREMVVYLRRWGGQSQFSNPLKLQAYADKVSPGLSQFVIQNMRSPLSLVDLAEFAGMSPEHLARRFKSETGVSPMRYVEQQRLEQARAVLTSFRAPIKQVAGMVGYLSPDVFARAFRRRFGISPSQILKTGADAPH